MTLLSRARGSRHTLGNVVTRLRTLVFVFAMALGVIVGFASPQAAYAQLDPEPSDEPLPGATEEPTDPDAAEPEAAADPDASDPDAADPEAATLPSDPAAEADTLAQDEPAYEPDQRGVQDEPAGVPEPEEAGPPMAEQSAEGDSMRSIQLTSGTAESGFAEPSFYGFDVQLWLGGGLTSIEAFENQNLVRADQQGGFGASLGLSAGLRMGPITVGPRATLAIDPSFLLITVGADVRAILSTDAVAPTLRASLSGVFLTELSDALPSQTGAGGVHAELGAGVRWRFAAGFTFGAELSGGYLHLDRQGEASCEAPCTEGGFDLRDGGSSDGLTLRLHLSAGYRF